MKKYIVIDSTLRKFYYVDKKTKELLLVVFHNYNPFPGGIFLDYYDFIYYFHRGELIKLYVTQCASKKDCKKGVFYFSKGEVIQKKGVLTEDSNLTRPLEFSLNFKSFVAKKNNGG